MIKHFDVFRRPVPKYFPYLKIAENGFYESDISVVLNVIAIWGILSSASCFCCLPILTFFFFFFWGQPHGNPHNQDFAIPTSQYHKRTCRFNFDPNWKSADLNSKFSPSLITHCWGQLTVHKLNTVTIAKPRTAIPRMQLQPSFPFLPWQNVICVESNWQNDLSTYPLICLSQSIELLFMLGFYIAGRLTQWSEPTSRFYHLAVRSFSAIHHGNEIARLNLFLLVTGWF